MESLNGMVRSNQTKVLNNPIIFFDDNCNLCNRFVRLLIKLDKKRILRYSYFHSQITNKIPELKEYLIPPYQTVVLFAEQKIYIKSDALIKVINYFNYPWKIFSVLKYIPRKYRDWFYELIANNRYKIFGRQDNCPVYQVDYSELFLN